MSEGHLTRDTLERLARRELTPRELAEARRHIESCPDCAAIADAPPPVARWAVLAAAAAMIMVLVLATVAVKRCGPKEYHSTTPVNRP
jgi:hypothetical protein